MNAKFILSLLLLFAATFALEAKDDATEWRYDIECAGSGEQGTYLIKVWTYSKKANVPSDLMKKNAVHGIIFRGFSGQQGCTSQKPIAQTPSVYQEKEDFFKAFFANGGTFLKYANITSPTPETVKVGKNEYKVGVVISVSKDLLRKDLEAAGIIKGLGAGF